MNIDEQLQQAVLAELKREPTVNAAQISVEVREGLVILSGFVSSHAETWNTERAARRVSGVKALANRMNIRLSASGRQTDADIARAAQIALCWATSLPKNSISVIVDNGWITLCGEVNWEHQRQAVTRALRYLMGVTGISDQVTIKRTATSSAVKSELQAAMKRRSTANVRKISAKDRSPVQMST